MAAPRNHYYVAFHNLLKVKLKVSTALHLPAYLLNGMKSSFLMLQMSSLLQTSLRHSWHFLEESPPPATLNKTKVTGEASITARVSLCSSTLLHSLPLGFPFRLVATHTSCKPAWPMRKWLIPTLMEAFPWCLVLFFF